MRIATFNVNSLKARLHAVTGWLRDAQPDVACLQELKCEDLTVPRQELEDLGYNLITHGQKTYNGVAILSKWPFDDIRRGLPGDDKDEQARYIEAVILSPTPVRVASIYAPNGNPVDRIALHKDGHNNSRHCEEGASPTRQSRSQTAETAAFLDCRAPSGHAMTAAESDGRTTAAPSGKFLYKLKWLDRLYHHARDLLKLEERLILAGDYNIIPTDDDCHDPAAWAGDALAQPESRAAYRRLLNLGLVDAYVQADGRPHQYTFWDYQAGAWQRDHGIRIDHLLLSPQAADRLQAVEIHRSVRAGEKPSDHVPIMAEI